MLFMQLLLLQEYKTWCKKNAQIKVFHHVHSPCKSTWKSCSSMFEETAQVAR